MKKSTLANIGRTIDVTYTLCRGRKVGKGVAKINKGSQVHHNWYLLPFLFPILVTAIYCFIGIFYGLWHPYWFLFILIPLFYIIAEGIDKVIHNKK